MSLAIVLRCGASKKKSSKNGVVISSGANQKLESWTILYVDAQCPSLKTPQNDRSLALLPIQPADVVWGTGDCRPRASHALIPDTIHRSR
jgi:hypothetical protein